MDVFQFLQIVGSALAFFMDRYNLGKKNRQVALAIINLDN